MSGTDTDLVAGPAAAGRRVTCVAGLHLRTFLREPLNLVLLVALPVVVVEGFGYAMASYPQPPGTDIPPAASGKAIGAAFVTAFLAGVFSLYQATSATTADGRALFAGLGPGTLFAARALSILVVDIAVTALGYAVFARSVAPARLGVGYLALLLGAVAYSLLGLIVGALLSGLFEGSLVVLFLADLDAFLGSGMASVGASGTLFPLHYPYQLFEGAVFGGTVDASLLPPAVAYLAVLGLGAYLVVRYRVTEQL